MVCDLCKREFSVKVQDARPLAIGEKSAERCSMEETQTYSGCLGCAQAKGCVGIRCPYCYYEMVPQPGWLQKLFSIFTPMGLKNRTATSSLIQIEQAISLTSLEIKRKARIDHLDMENHKKLEELIAMGVLPGKEIEVIQRFPSFVFQIGFSQFSIDEELAACIHVRPLGVK